MKVIRSDYLEEVAGVARHATARVGRYCLQLATPAMAKRLVADEDSTIRQKDELLVLWSRCKSEVLRGCDSFKNVFYGEPYVYERDICPAAAG